MTPTAERVKRRPAPSLVLGLLSLVLGIAAVVVGVPWTWLEHDGWPWTDTITHDAASGHVEVAIAHPDGRTEVHQTATEAEALAWMDQRNGELKVAYNLEEKITAGRVLGPLGFVLFASGSGMLIWRSVSVTDRRRLRAGDTATS